MTKKDPLTYQKLWPRRSRTLDQVLYRAEEIGPFLGVTQGGSSRPDSGSRSAATRGVKRATKRNEHDNR